MMADIQGVREGAGSIGAVLGSSGPNVGHALVRAGATRKFIQGLVGIDEPAYYRELSKLLLSKDPKVNSYALRLVQALPEDQGPGVLARALTVAGGIAPGQMK